MAPARTFHDQHSKSIVDSLLSVASKVHRNYAIDGLSQYTDVMVEFGRRTPKQRVQQGLLGRVNAERCLIENYRNTPGLHEMRTSISRQHNFYNSLVRKARAGTGLNPNKPADILADKPAGILADKPVDIFADKPADILPDHKSPNATQPPAPNLSAAKRKRKLRNPRFPALWINSTGEPKAIIRGYRFEQIPGWPRGCLHSVPCLNTYLIVISALDEIEETLALRLLGRGQVMRTALRQLFELPEDHGLRQRLVPTVLDFALNPASQLPSDQLDKDAMAYLDEIYSRYNAWESATLARGHQAGLEEGREEGRKEGRKGTLQETLLKQLRLKFGKRAEEFAGRIQAAEVADLERWTERVLTAGKPHEVFAND